MSCNCGNTPPWAHTADRAVIVQFFIIAGLLSILFKASQDCIEAHSQVFCRLSNSLTRFFVDSCVRQQLGPSTFREPVLDGEIVLAFLRLLCYGAPLYVPYSYIE